VIAGLRVPVPFVRGPSFAPRGISLVVALILLSSPLSAQAQDAGGAPPPVTEDTTPIGPPPLAPQPAAPAPAVDPGRASPEPTVPPASPSLDDQVASQSLSPAGPDPTLPHDLSPWGMFLAADWVVKAVMVGLAFASLMTWTIWLAKSVEIAGAKARGRRAIVVIAGAASIAAAASQLARRGGPAALMARMAQSEMARSEDVLDHAGNQGLSNRVLSHLLRIEAQAGRRLTRGTGILATIGSTAPFVGLFGTVWGIMNAFIGISEAQTTNLAIVAPGIAEALLATAIGLVAAIPAVVFYNVFARSIAGYKQLLADASAAVERLVSLDLDRRKGPSRAMRPAAE